MKLFKFVKTSDPLDFGMHVLAMSSDQAMGFYAGKRTVKMYDQLQVTELPLLELDTLTHRVEEILFGPHPEIARLPGDLPLANTAKLRLKGGAPPGNWPCNGAEFCVFHRVGECKWRCNLCDQEFGMIYR